MTTEVVIKGAHGGRIDVKEGQYLDVINVEGQQICDFFAFKASDLAERLSPAHCRTMLQSIVPKVGDKLVTNLRRPMLEIVEDTVGTHDMVIPPCDPNVYVIRFGLQDHRSCRTNMAEAMADYDLAYECLPDPVNFFQNTPVLPDGSIEFRGSLAKPGDRVVLRALMDVIAVGSACPMPGGVSGEKPTDIKFVVRDR
ncbi:MAG TPA: urea carboxylase-associated family protein [Hyphomicrobiaceae bacterium]|nr:urea carboxylase-associated family protein [Hyphomicrobiaceae bacterium]